MFKSRVDRWSEFISFIGFMLLGVGSVIVIYTTANLLFKIDGMSVWVIIIIRIGLLCILTSILIPIIHTFVKTFKEKWEEVQDDNFFKMS